MVNKNFQNPNLITDQCVALGCWFSITVPNLVQKFRLMSKLWPKNEIQNCNRRYLEFISGGYL